MPDMDGDNQFKRNIDLNKDTDSGYVCFAEFFPSVIGHAKIVDEYHADPRSPYYSTVNFLQSTMTTLSFMMRMPKVQTGKSSRRICF